MEDEYEEGVWEENISYPQSHHHPHQPHPHQHPPPPPPAAHHHMGLFSPGGGSMESLSSIPEEDYRVVQQQMTSAFNTSVESLSSIPEGRVTPSSSAPFLHTSRRVHRHHSSASSSTKDAVNSSDSPRPWAASLRRQNSAPQLERGKTERPPWGAGSSSRHRLGCSSDTRHSSSESLNSDAGSHRSRCPACSAHPHDDDDPFTSHTSSSPAFHTGRVSPAPFVSGRVSPGFSTPGRSSPAFINVRKPSLRRNPGGEVHSCEGSRRRGGGVEDAPSEDDVVMMRRPRRHSDSHSSGQGQGQTEENCQSGRRKKSDRHSLDGSSLPRQHTARRLKAGGRTSPSPPVPSSSDTHSHTTTSPRTHRDSSPDQHHHHPHSKRNSDMVSSSSLAAVALPTHSQNRARRKSDRKSSGGLVDSPSRAAEHNTPSPRSSRTREDHHHPHSRTPASGGVGGAVRPRQRNSAGSGASSVDPRTRASLQHRQASKEGAVPNHQSPLRSRSGYLDLEKVLREKATVQEKAKSDQKAVVVHSNNTAHDDDDDERSAVTTVNGEAKSEHEVETERQWLEAERVWLVHKGGFTPARLQSGEATGDGNVNIKLDSGETLEVEEEDVEKANPSTQDEVQDVAVLRYVNESSVLHVLRQRYASSLPNTFAGPTLITLNPMKHLPIFSEKLIQMLRGCKQEDMFPHPFSLAQTAYRSLLSSRRDQSLVFLGRSGSGKTTSAIHCLHYLLVAAGSVNNIFTVEKLSAINTLLQAFGTCRTLLNTTASRFTQITTLDFDPSGVIASASVQVVLFEKSRVVRRPEGEPTFSIFYQLLAGADAQLRNELHLQNLTEPNQFMTPLQREDDRQKAAGRFGMVMQAFSLITASAEEVKAVISVLAAVYHLGVAGATKGAHNKFQFSRPAAAQKAANLLGTSTEDLARAIFSLGGAGSSSSLSRATSLRVGGVGMDKGGYHSADMTTSPTEALEAFVTGLYSDAFNAVVSLINRSLSSNVRTMSSLAVVDAPGFQNAATGGRQTGGTLEDLCCNYLHERLQLLFHEHMLTAPQDRYAQENVDCDCDVVTSSPAPMVSLMDQAPAQGLVRTSNTDLKGSDKRGLLWILDEEAMYPGGSEDSFMDRLFSQHGDSSARKDSLLRKGSRGHTFVLNHNQGTSPVQYNAAGWLRTCRDNPISKNSTVLLQDSKSPAVSQLFGSLKGSVGGVVSGSIAGMEGSTSLRRVGSMRRTFMSGTAALKKKSVCLQVKFQVDSVMETLRKTHPHFVLCLLPQQNAGLCDLMDKSGSGGQGHDLQVNVPLLRSQLRGFEVLDALRLHRQGFPEFMEFREFVQKFQAMVPPTSRPAATADHKQAVNQVLDNLDVDKLNYRVGLSKVFFRPGVLSQLEAGRDDKLTGIVTHFQALCRGFLGRKRTEKLRVQHLAVRCIQRNVNKYLAIREWDWWKLYTKVKPILNVHRTEEELLEAQAELENMKSKTEKLEKERNEYKAACEKLESRLQEVTADLMEENTTSTQATELLEAESAERMRLEKELKDLQAKYSPLKRQNEKLQMEVMQSRVWQAQPMEDEEDEVDGEGSVYKERYQRVVRESQVARKQLQDQHEEDLEQELASRKMVEKRLHEAVEEAEEQRRQVQVAKKKTQRLTGEMQDMKRLLEEQMARNNELERKQRRFDNELGMAQEDVREERHLREKLQRERDSLLSEKYGLEQTIQTLKMDTQSATEKADRLDKELNDILVSGKDNSEVVSLKRAKHELELKLREQEEELDDQAGQIQQLEQTKLRLEMNMEKMKKQHQTEVEEKEEELEDMRTKTQKKLRSMEAQLEEEYEEKRRVMEEKANLERQLADYSARAPQRDRESEKRLRRNLKKTKALLADAGTMLAKQKNMEGAKQQIAQLRNQLDEAEFRGAAAVKAKKRMELEIQDLSQQIEDLSRAKQEVETKNMSLMREKADLQSQLEENEDEMSEVMKKYKAAVQQQSVHQITMTDQLQQIEELIKERDQLRLEVADLTARVQGYEEGSVDKHSVTRLESKLRELEGKADLEQSQRQRFESQVSRLKDQVEKLTTEKEELNSHRQAAEEMTKRGTKQLRELREELADAQKKEMEACQKFQERESEVDSMETELAQNRADLKLAFKRITDLQAALEDELDSDDDSLQLQDSDLSDDDDDDLDSYFSTQRRASASLRTSSTFSSPRSERYSTPNENGFEA